MALAPFICLHLISNQINAQILSLSSGWNSLPKPLFGSYITVNSQKEVIIIGGCDWYSSTTSNGCSSDDYSSNVYAWNLSSSSVTFNDITPSENPSVPKWSPSIGYPLPLYQDNLYVPWYDAIYKYDTIKKEWLTDTLSSIPTPLYYPCTVHDKIKNKIYLLGGMTVTDNILQLYGSVQIYDINTDSWESYTDIAQMPISSYGGSCVLKNRTIYHFGGMTNLEDYSALNTIYKLCVDICYNIC